MAKMKFDAATVEAILSGEHSAAAWLSTGTGLDDLDLSDAISAIEAARRSENSTRLQEARKGAGHKLVRKAAGTAIHRLKASGVTVAAAATQQWVPRAGLDEIPPPVALLGMPDPHGYFPFVMIAFGKEEGCASAGLAGGGQGFTDTDHAHVGRKSAREVLHHGRTQQGLEEVPFHVALHFIQRAFEEASSGKPHGFDHMLNSVPEGIQNSARLLDPLEGQPTELDRDALHEVEALMDPRGGVYLALGETDMEAGFVGVMDALTSKLEIDDESRKERIGVVIDDVADALLNEVTRRSWALAMDVVTYLAHCREDDAVEKCARHTALALRAGMAGRDVPFIRGWVDTQLHHAAENMAQMGALSPDGKPGESPIILPGQ
ncbi:MAG: hypothetical protein ACI8RZ_002929 [Myxococcota bacterium]|jgi:hypothetical protein